MGLELTQELSILRKSLYVQLDDMRQYGANLAESERSYRTRLSCEIMKARARGDPVTIIDDLCRGAPEVADLRYARDIDRSIYKASVEAINVTKLQIRVIENQISREWQG